MPGAAHGASARAAVENLATGLALEWSRYGIRSNCVSVGTVATEGLRQYGDIVSEWVETIPLETPGTTRRGGLGDRVPALGRRQLRHRNGSSLSTVEPTRGGWAGTHRLSRRQSRRPTPTARLLVDRRTRSVDAVAYTLVRWSLLVPGGHVGGSSAMSPLLVNICDRPGLRAHRGFLRRRRDRARLTAREPGRRSWPSSGGRGRAVNGCTTTRTDFCPRCRSASRSRVSCRPRSVPRPSPTTSRPCSKTGACREGGQSGCPWSSITLSIVYLSLVLGELAPKRLALQRAEGLAAASQRRSSSSSRRSRHR